jgi:ribosomal protein L28
VVDGKTTRVKICTRCLKAGKIVSPRTMSKAPAA